MGTPIRDVREARISLWVDTDYQIGPNRPAYVGTSRRSARGASLLVADLRISSMCGRSLSQDISRTPSC